MRTHLFLAQHNLKCVVEIQPAIHQCDSADRNQSILLHIQPATFDIDDDVARIGVRHIQISCRQLPPSGDDFALLGRQIGLLPSGGGAKQLRQPVHD